MLFLITPQFIIDCNKIEIFSLYEYNYRLIEKLFSEKSNFIIEICDFPDYIKKNEFIEFNKKEIHLINSIDKILEKENIELFDNLNRNFYFEYLKNFEKNFEKDLTFSIVDKNLFQSYLFEKKILNKINYCCFFYFKKRNFEVESAKSFGFEFTLYQNKLEKEKNKHFHSEFFVLIHNNNTNVWTNKEILRKLRIANNYKKKLIIYYYNENEEKYFFNENNEKNEKNNDKKEYSFKIIELNKADFFN